MSSEQARSGVELTVVAFAVASIVVLIATPALAAPSTNGEPAITTNWWVVLGGLFVGTLLVQGTALMLARRQRSTPALILSMLFAWLVVETATGVMWVSVTMLTASKPKDGSRSTTLVASATQQPRFDPPVGSMPV